MNIKTSSKSRGIYTYKNVDGTSIILFPGEDGITELYIKQLHALYDSEIYYTNKNALPNRTAEEKKEIENWKKTYIERLKEDHGYESNKEYVDGYARDAFLPNYNLSINYSFEE